MDAQEKEAKLIEWLREKGHIAIAFSGGVDSTYLLRVAIDALGSDNVLPMHAQAQLHSRREEHEAEDYARDMGAHLVVLPMDMHAVPGLCDNPPDRCYICKTAVFTALWDYARAHGFDTLADGSNADDVGDYRPGMRALKELGYTHLTLVEEQRLPDGQLNAYSPANYEKGDHGQFTEKYGKFVYSTRFGFSASRSYVQLEQTAPDSMLAFVIDGWTFVRRHSDKFVLLGDRLLSEWRPFPGIKVTTELVPAKWGHVRNHTVESTIACTAYDLSLIHI